MLSHIVFEGLEALQARIRKLNTDASLLYIWDRTDPNAEERLGRFELEAAYALPYLTLASSTRDKKDDDTTSGNKPQQECDTDDTGSLEEEMDDESGPSRQPSFQQILEAACRWVRDVAQRNMTGEKQRRFRVKIYGPKGEDYIESGTFLARNVREERHDEESALEKVMPPTSIPLPSFDEAAMSATAKGVKTLGDLYAQWGHVMMGGVGQLQMVNTAMIGKLHQQLTESREQVEQLVASILEFRTSQIEAAESRTANARQDESRVVLARDALNHLGEMARAFMTMKGLTPEMAEVAGLLGSSPELTAALKEPDVRALLKEPAHLSMLASMLKQFGQQLRTGQLGASAPSSPAHGTDQAA